MQYIAILTLLGICLLLFKFRQQEKYMSALDDKIADLQAEVAQNTSVEKSALAIIQGIGAQIAAAVNAALAAGATAAQLQSLTDLQTTLAANDSELAAAVTASTTPATTS